MTNHHSAYIVRLKSRNIAPFALKQCVSAVGHTCTSLIIDDKAALEVVCPTRPKVCPLGWSSRGEKRVDDVYAHSDLSLYAFTHRRIAAVEHQQADASHYDCEA